VASVKTGPNGPVRTDRTGSSSETNTTLGKFNFEAAALILALILGKTPEESLRQALGISQGSFAVFVTQPISLVLLLAAAGSLAAPAVRWALRGRTAG
jgi:putative tricarboxylic transport membrane protein